MNNIKKISAFITSGALLLGSFVPAFATTTLTVSGNGTASENEVVANSSQTNTVVQNNQANITNTVESSNSTGNNTASDNTGGDVMVNTGNASSTVRIENSANMNKAVVNGCGSGCTGNNTSVAVSGNGSFSDSRVELNNNSATNVYQNNNANFDNQVRSNNSTGGNNASRNTGGDTTVVTGHASSDVAVRNMANANELRMGSGNGSSSSTNVAVEGNGTSSDNHVAVQSNRSANLVQDNSAYFVNDVFAKNKTGYNQAKDNTGGNTYVDTGNARSLVRVDNMANFNAADLGCGCMTGNLNAKVKGNGSFSDNSVFFGTNDWFSVDQGREGGNQANLTNRLNTKNASGENYANRNTGAVNNPFDPVTMFTGHSLSDSRVNNTANMNVLGSLPAFHFSFDLNGLMHSFMYL